MNFVGITNWDGDCLVTIALASVVSGTVIACIYLLLLYEVGKVFLQRVKKGAGGHE